jgi:biopolymer transport protein ExbD
VSGRGSPVGYGLYFIDVLASLIFCLVLILVGARFSSETTVPVDLPEIGAATGAATAPDALSVTIREEAGATRFYLEDRPVSLEALGAALRDRAPGAIRIRSEATALARVIGVAHESGVRDVELAYEIERGSE